MKNLSAAFDYATAYNAVFVGYGIMALIGLSIVLFLMGPLVKDKALQDYVDAGERDPASITATVH